MHLKKPNTLQMIATIKWDIIKLKWKKLKVRGNFYQYLFPLDGIGQSSPKTAKNNVEHWPLILQKTGKSYVKISFVKRKFNIFTL